MKTEREYLFITAALFKQKKRSGSHLVVSTHSLGPAHLRKGRGGGGEDEVGGEGGGHF